MYGSLWRNDIATDIYILQDKICDSQLMDNATDVHR